MDLVKVEGNNVRLGQVERGDPAVRARAQRDVLLGVAVPDNGVELAVRASRLSVQRREAAMNNADTYDGDTHEHFTPKAV